MRVTTNPNARGTAAELAAKVNANVAASTEPGTTTPPSARAELPVVVPEGAQPPSAYGHPVSRRSSPQPTRAEREADALAVVDRWRANGWQ